MTPENHRNMNTALIITAIIFFMTASAVGVGILNKQETSISECEEKLYQHLTDSEYPFSGGK